MNLRDELTTNAKPGDDFYNFVNKKWCDDNPIPDDKSRYGVMTKLSDTVTLQLHDLLDATKDTDGNAGLAQQLYTSGMDEAAIEARGLDPLAPAIAEIEALTSPADIAALIAKRHSEGRGLVWYLGLDVDEKNSARYVMTFNQGGLLLPDRDYYFETGEEFETARKAYRMFLTQLFELLGKTDVKQHVDAVFNFEQKLAKASNTAIENRDVDALYNPRTFAELADAMGDFDWAAYQKQTKLGSIDQLIVHQPKFMQAATGLIASEPISDWQDYVLAHTVAGYMPCLSKAFDDVHFAFYGTALTGAKKRQDRFKRIIGMTTALLPEPIGQLYTQAHFDESAKAVITDLVVHIQDALRVRIMQLDWMSDTTKEKALEKLDTFLPLLGYPDEWRSYDGLKLTDDYVENILAIRRFDWEYDLGRIHDPVDRKEWGMSPATVNAYYWPNTNGITFPAAILQPPIFDAHGDFAANYGAIGAVIGHEITHGFDDKGSKYDKIGNLNSWWTDVDLKHFEKRAKQLIDQYDAYEVNGQHVKGELTLGENIADLGGLLIAYDALQAVIQASGNSTSIDGLTPAQRFFISFATVWRNNIRPEIALQLIVSDPHSPAYYRVNGVVPNMDAWYDAWDISTDDALYRNPDERARIW